MSFIVAMVTNQWGECLAENMIKEANVSKFFSDSSQIMLKLSSNIQWVELYWRSIKVDAKLKL